MAEVQFLYNSGPRFIFRKNGHGRSQGFVFNTCLMKSTRGCWAVRMEEEKKDNGKKSTQQQLSIVEEILILGSIALSLPPTSAIGILNGVK